MPQPIVIDASERGRQFVCSAVALQAIIVNEREEILLLASPRRYETETWQVVSGALEAGETILAGVLRETREEVGDVQVRPLGVVHVQTFHYDANVQYMIGIYYLLAYEGGVVRPGDDMVESLFRWWSLDELADENVRLFVANLRWILERAVPLYRLWQGQVVDLQPGLDGADRAGSGEREAGSVKRET